MTTDDPYLNRIEYLSNRLERYFERLNERLDSLERRVSDIEYPGLTDIKNDIYRLQDDVRQVSSGLDSLRRW